MLVDVAGSRSDVENDPGITVANGKFEPKDGTRQGLRRQKISRLVWLAVACTEKDAAAVNRAD